MMDLERQNPSAAHWPKQHYDRLFVHATDRGTSERYAWVVEEDQIQQPEDNWEADPRLFGFLIAHRINDVWELENLIINTAARRQGLGTLLVTQLLAYSRETLASAIFLEVRESNRAARDLYEKIGFKKAGLRKNYYSSPQENALLYRIKLC
jgi:ribosomal-protein-alanine acetyltransferase